MSSNSYRPCWQTNQPLGTSRYLIHDNTNKKKRSSQFVLLPDALNLDLCSTEDWDHFLIGCVRWIDVALALFPMQWSCRNLNESVELNSNKICAQENETGPLHLSAARRPFVKRCCLLFLLDRHSTACDPINSRKFHSIHLSAVQFKRIIKF